MEGVVWLILISHHLFDTAVLGLLLLLQGAGVVWILRGPAAKAPARVRRGIILLAVTSFALETFAAMLRSARVSQYFPLWFANWGRGLVIAWALFSILFLAVFALTGAVRNLLPNFSPRRRGFIRAAQLALLAAPAVAVGYGIFIERLRISLREENIQIPGLPPDLDGLRIVQLTDIHLSPFLSVRELERAVAIANETRAHLALVTGDLITSPGDPLNDCIDRLAGLRADAGIFGCLGNHEAYAGVEDYTTMQGARRGVRFLRAAAQPLQFGNATLNLAGVDYQRFGQPYLVGGERLVRPGAFNLLLSHNPDVFPVAARQGYQLTIAGHTHGGQVRVEILRQDLNVARFFTRYVDGLYRSGSSSIFVCRGIGTIGIPARLGSAPEVALIKLCRT